MIADQRQGMEKFARSTGEPRDTGRSFSHGDCDGKERGELTNHEPEIEVNCRDRGYPGGPTRKVSKVNRVQNSSAIPHPEFDRDFIRHRSLHGSWTIIFHPILDSMKNGEVRSITFRSILSEILSIVEISRATNTQLIQATY